jgi:NAD(P)H-flavin reductase/hemoglobin-like flavoprotein
MALDGGYPEGTAGRIPGQQRPDELGGAPGPRSGASVRLTGIYADPMTPAAGQHAQNLSPQSESPALDGDAAGGRGDEAAQVNGRLIKESFAYVLADARKAMEYFYAHLFVQNPEIRAMFPLAMGEVREAVFHALSQLIWIMDSPEASAAYLGQIGRDHRKFGVKDKHHDAFFEALLVTVEHFSGADWTAETKAAWEAVLHDAKATMRAAAAADASRQPPWWVGEVIRHDRRTGSVAVLTIRPDRPLSYVPGQYVGVQVLRWPRVWRRFSVANAPRASGLLDLHVRAVPGGLVSNALVHHVGTGSTVLLGQARGAMTVPDAPARDLVCVAGGTGLAPIKAIIEAVTGSASYGRRRNITLFVGARRQEDLYDMADLRVLRSACPSLLVIPVVSHDLSFPGTKGLLPDVVRRHASFENSDVFISGPDDMVRETERVLARRVAAEHIHRDPLTAAGAGAPGTWELSR